MNREKAIEEQKNRQLINFQLSIDVEINSIIKKINRELSNYKPLEISTNYKLKKLRDIKLKLKTI